MAASQVEALGFPQRHPAGAPSDEAGHEQEGFPSPKVAAPNFSGPVLRPSTVQAEFDGFNMYQMNTQW